MCNKARYRGEPEALLGSSAELFTERPRDNPFNAVELRPKSRNYIIREQDGKRAWGVMTWDALGGQEASPMTNVRNLNLPQWCRLAEKPTNRYVISLRKFAEFTPEKHDLGDDKVPLEAEMWFSVVDQPTFAVAGFWQRTADGSPPAAHGRCR
jgi:putative SOS response-associated peptidase YedK